MGLCPYCMRPAEGSFCPSCGKALSYEANANHLPLETLLPVGGGWHTYQLGAALGQGGFGITYAALLLETGQRVAVKEYFPTSYVWRKPDHSVAPKPGKEEVFDRGMKGFLREAKLLAGLRPLSSVVKALDFFQYNGTAYMAMEFLDGVSLSSKVRKEGPIPAQQLLPRLKPLLDDMDAMHKSKIIHRDVAPDNIMWMPDGTLKLIDFGCARSTEATELTMMFKPRFAAIEQYTKKSQGPWTDVYGMAATIFFCLTGKAPDDAIARLEDPNSLRLPLQMEADLTPEQDQALLWALSVQPQDRPQTMAEFTKRFCNEPEPPRGLVEVLRRLWQSVRGLLPGVLLAALLLSAPLTRFSAAAGCMGVESGLTASQEEVYNDYR